MIKHIKQAGRWLTYGFLIFIIYGCTTAPAVQPVEPPDQYVLWQQQKSSNSRISNWILKGKIGVKTGKKGGSATLNWTYRSDTTQDIELYGPFGGGRIQISTNNDSATLRDTKGAIIEGDTADAVLYQKLGWHVPFTELVNWSRGIPDDNATDIVIDQDGRLESLNQGIWHVEYQEYRNYEGLILPRKLTITSIPGALKLYDKKGRYIGDELRVKVILKRWSGIGFG
jgi:outer membrane lipoprotein LolB